MKYSPSIISLKDLPFQKYNKDFTFIVDGRRYQTQRIVADLLSPKIRKLHFIDSTITEFYFDTDEQSIENNDEKDYFHQFLQLIFSKDNDIDTTEQKQYSTYFLKLGNINEFLRLQPEYSSPLSIDNAIDRLILIDNLSINFSEEIDHWAVNIDDIISFIASNFNRFPEEGLKRLSIEFLSIILNSKELRITDEDSLFEFVTKLYEEDHTASELYSSILFCNVSLSNIELFVKTISFEDVNLCIWNSICKRLLSSSEASEKDEMRYIETHKVFKAEVGHEFEGIMNYLTKQTGGNIQENGTIKITSNSRHDIKYLRNIVEYKNNDQFFFNLKSAENFACFDFKEKSIQLSEYSIKTYGTGQDGHHLKNWCIEVSNDGSDWIEIDRRSDGSILNGPYKQSVFKVNKKLTSFYRFIRLRQTGISCRIINNYYEKNKNSYEFDISMIEFFGMLKERN